MQQHRTWKLLCSLWSTMLHSVAFFIDWNVLDFCDNQTCMYIIEKSRKDSLLCTLYIYKISLEQLISKMKINTVQNPGCSSIELGNIPIFEKMSTIQALPNEVLENIFRELSFAKSMSGVQKMKYLTL